MPATRTRKPEARIARLMQLGASTVLALTSGRDTTFYTLTPLASDFGTAYRLQKADRGNGPEETYDVCLLDGGRSTCECKGHLRGGHKTICKHIAALGVLRQQGKLPAAAKPRPAPCPTVCEFDDP